MVGKPVTQQRVGAGVPGGSNTVGNSDCLLPDWPRIGYLENSRGGIKELPQIHEINMGTNVVSAEIVHRIERSKIDALRDCLPCFNPQWRLRAICGGGRNRLAFTSSYLKSKPGLPIGIVKLDIAAGQVG